MSGISAGSWEPVHEFCERTELPYLFPNTDLAVDSPSAVWSVYFNKGLSLEAQALAQHIKGSERPGSTRRIVQVLRNHERGVVPAEVLRNTLQDHGNIEVVTRTSSEPPRSTTAGFTTAFWKQLLEDNPPSILVLWLDDADLSWFVAATRNSKLPERIYLSSTLLKDIPMDIPARLKERLYLTYPKALPGKHISNLLRARGWMRTRGLEKVHESTQLNTFLTLSVTDHALVHILDNFSRAYFLEEIEHEAEQGLIQSVYAHLSLGPGQRFGSKGCYIVRVSEAAPGGIEAVSEWIVP